MIAGAGIGGLTAALTLARKGFRVVLLEQAPQLEETGAGVQLSPNATRILLALGLGDALAPSVVVPEEIRIRQARTGDDIVRVRLGEFVENRYGAPYWVAHRSDVQAALAEAARTDPDIELKLDAVVEDFAVHGHGITVAGRLGGKTFEERGIGLVGADGLWSTTRARLGDEFPPLFAGRTAWRAVVPADQVGVHFHVPLVNLWLGWKAHLVHFPVKAGTLVNIVAIVSDNFAKPGWSEPGSREELLARFSSRFWAESARTLLATPEQWVKWPLYDRPPARHWGAGPVTLLGDAAHPMLPFLAQGAAMAIEDAVVLAECLDPANHIGLGMRRYESWRRARTARAQRAARKNNRRFHLIGPDAAVRNFVLRRRGGYRLIRRYDWIYKWRFGELR
jgi:salicylate hydroxylase